MSDQNHQPVSLQPWLVAILDPGQSLLLSILIDHQVPTPLAVQHMWWGHKPPMFTSCIGMIQLRPWHLEVMKMRKTLSQLAKDSDIEPTRPAFQGPRAPCHEKSRGCGAIFSFSDATYIHMSSCISCFTRNELRWLEDTHRDNPIVLQFSKSFSPMLQLYHGSGLCCGASISLITPINQPVCFFTWLRWCRIAQKQAGILPEDARACEQLRPTR